MRGILLTFATISMLFSHKVYAGLADVIEQVRPSIVAVGTVMPLRRPSARFYGTGFVIGDGRMIVTNHHVIPEIINRKKREHLAIFSGRGKKGKAHKVRILKADPDHDIVVLELLTGKLPPLKLASHGVREGDKIAFTGFPIGMVLGLYPVTHEGIVSAITPVVIPANNSNSLTAKQIKRLRDRFEVFQLDATAYPGNSGSPVYNTKTGAVLGVLNSVFVKDTKETLLERPSGISYAIPISHLKKLIPLEKSINQD